jgi:hypothetical protein
MVTTVPVVPRAGVKEVIAGSFDALFRSTVKVLSASLQVDEVGFAVAVEVRGGDGIGDIPGYSRRSG